MELQRTRKEPGPISSPSFEGPLEIHLTVRVSRPEELDVLREWASLRDWKLTHIVLDGGKHPSQPMLSRRINGTLGNVLAGAEIASAELAPAGFVASRIKVESAPWIPGVPETGEVAASHPERYFEHHVKLLLLNEVDQESVRSAVAGHSARLSRNAFRARPDGQHERFVTQRCWWVGRVEAHERLERLIAALEPLGYPLLEIEEEYVVYDSNPQIDAGWIEGTTP